MASSLCREENTEGRGETADTCTRVRVSSQWMHSRKPRLEGAAQGQLAMAILLCQVSMLTVLISKCYMCPEISPGVRAAISSCSPRQQVGCSCPSRHLEQEEQSSSPFPAGGHFSSLLPLSRHAVAAEHAHLDNTSAKHSIGLAKPPGIRRFFLFLFSQKWRCAQVLEPSHGIYKLRTEDDACQSLPLWAPLCVVHIFLVFPVPWWLPKEQCTYFLEQSQGRSVSFQSLEQPEQGKAPSCPAAPIAAQDLQNCTETPEKPRNSRKERTPHLHPAHEAAHSPIFPSVDLALLPHTARFSALQAPFSSGTLPEKEHTTNWVILFFIR
ncbi:uncharacterized protein LOC134424507 [Melospiza melodia melodia]|uniref:uncharacterized protein LOC134424507 n=1 Tax=Melospiza melodia melodia TaxID=1914991 RepID=UPI002FCFF5D8